MIDNILQSLSIGGRCIGVDSYKNFICYNIKLDTRQRISKLESSIREIGLALQSNTTTISVIPEKGIVQIQIQNKERQNVLFDELYKVDQPGILPIVVGERPDSTPVWIDLAKNPHMLIAGTTGSGKSVLGHTIIKNLLKLDNVELYLVDPKYGMEFMQYSDRAYSLALTYDDCIEQLEDLYSKMESRFDYMGKYGMNGPFPFNKCVVIIDEVADLMMYDNSRLNKRRGTFERLIASISQKSRAAGIYIIMATQRPSVDVIRGAIKANFPARIACKVNSSMDSKVILNRVGAEDLAGAGDSIIYNYNNNYVRFQAAI